VTLLEDTALDIGMKAAKLSSIVAITIIDTIFLFKSITLESFFLSQLSFCRFLGTVPCDFKIIKSSGTLFYSKLTLFLTRAWQSAPKPRLSMQLQPSL
jgi:hypothetical protein